MARRSDAEMLMELIPLDGTFVSNKTLQNKLSWPEDKYWKVRDTLLQAKQLERGRGKGGTVGRLVADASQAKTATARSPEVQLYDPLLETLKRDWVREMRIDPAHIHFEITARQGKKATGGTWTRPDITAVSVRTFQHLPNKYVDVWTFEVKTLDALDVTAVFEAASHAGRATRSYALLQISGDSGATYEEQVVDRCTKEATRLRVGLIVFSSPSDFATWDTKVEAPRIETAPEILDEFVTNLSDGAKERLAKWK
jgi:hypothetical protein